MKFILPAAVALAMALLITSCHHKAPQPSTLPVPATVIQQDHSAFEAPVVAPKVEVKKPAAVRVTPKHCRQATIDTTKDAYWSGVKGPLRALRCDPVVKQKLHKRPKPKAPVVPVNPETPAQPLCPIANLPCPWRTN